MSIVRFYWTCSDPMRVADFNENSDIIDAALSLLSAERVAVGSYVGNGKKNRTIKLPFTPTMVFLFGTINSGSALTIATAETEFYMTGSSGASGNNTRVVENGFQVGRTYASWHNESGCTEHYVAIR